jgi:uncharacterized SAM-binding protein YcdF (DUF218 family)
MFYALSKLLGFLLLPSSLIVLMIASGLLLQGSEGWRRIGLRLSASGLALLVVAGLSPVANWSVLPLEERFAPAPGAKPPRDIAGIIILGGFEDGRLSAARGGLALNEAGERITEAVRIAHATPGARVVFTGGVAGMLTSSAPAGEAVRRFLLDLGIAPERILIEGASRTTWENAVLTRDLVKPRPGERWLLVTSAFHMPRSVGTFRKAGFDVTPWPVDFRTVGIEDGTRLHERLSDGLRRLDEASKEWIGLLAYWASGRSSALWPGP